MLDARRVDVGDTPVQITSDETDAIGGRSIVLRVPSTETASIDIGPSDLVSGEAFEVPVGATFRGTLREAVWAVAPTGQTVTIHVLESGL